MKTDKGNSFATLLAVAVNGNLMTVKLNNRVPFQVSFEDMDNKVALVTERVQQGKKPSGTLEKQLLRIEHHRDQLVDAYVKILDCYDNMVDPPTRTPSKRKAQRDMLSIMPDKMLRQYAEAIGVDISDVILPDDKEALIETVIVALDV